MHLNQNDFFYKIFGSKLYLYSALYNITYSNPELVLTTTDFWIDTMIDSVEFNFNYYYLIFPALHSFNLEISFERIDNNNFKENCGSLLFDETFEKIKTGNQLIFNFCTNQINSLDIFHDLILRKQ